MPRVVPSSCARQNVIPATPSLVYQNDRPCSLGYAYVQPTAIVLTPILDSNGLVNATPRLWHVGRSPWAKALCSDIRVLSVQLSRFTYRPTTLAPTTISIVPMARNMFFITIFLGFEASNNDVGECLDPLYDCKNAATSRSLRRSCHLSGKSTKDFDC
jgi:hypothetical protein